MFSRVVNSERRVPVVAWLGLWLGLAVADSLGGGWPAASPSLRRGPLSAVAGACWLRANWAWERRDPDATLLAVRGAIAADPHHEYFWINGARMIAYDFPEWQTDAAAPEEVRRRVRSAFGRQAEALLRSALTVHPESPDLPIELAALRLRVFGDREGAAAWFGRAAGQRSAPTYAVRIQAQLLRELGRSEEALACLRRALDRLPGEEAMQRDVLRRRIEELEREHDGRCL